MSEAPHAVQRPSPEIRLVTTGPFRPRALVGLLARSANAARACQYVASSTIPGYFPPIVDEATYWQARAALAERAKSPTKARGRKGPVVTNLISGLGRCTACGASLIVVSHQAGKPFLQCSKARNSACRNRTAISYKKIEEKLLKVLSIFDVSALIGSRWPDAQRGAELEGHIAATEG